MMGNQHGFALPEGLRRHLIGWGGAARQCDVFKTLLWMARDYLRPKFDEEQRRKHEAHAIRRQTERVFLVDPTKPPALIDDGFYSEEPRNPEQMAAAEERLRVLGFEFDRRDNVIAYRLPHPEFVILADPRRPKSINFGVFHRLAPRCSRRAEVWCGHDAG